MEPKLDFIYDQVRIWQLVLSFLDIETMNEMDGTAYFQQKHQNLVFLRSKFIKKLKILLDKDRIHHGKDLYKNTSNKSDLLAVSLLVMFN